MAIGIDDLDFYEEGVETPPSTGETEPPQEPPQQPGSTQEDTNTPPSTGGEETPPSTSEGNGEDDIISSNTS